MYYFLEGPIRFPRLWQFFVEKDNKVTDHKRHGSNAGYEKKSLKTVDTEAGGRQFNGF